MSRPSIDQMLELRPFVRALARQLASDHALAEDIEQDTWVRALQRPPAHGQALKSWFSRVLRSVHINTATSERRRSDREHLSFEDRPNPWEPGPEHERFKEELEHALTSLPESHAEVVRLRYYDGLSAQEVAQRLGVPLATVRTRLRRSTDRMREDLDRRYDGDRDRWLGCLVALTALPPRRALPPAAVVVASVAVTAVAIVAFVTDRTPRPLPDARQLVRNHSLDSSAVELSGSVAQREVLAPEEEAVLATAGAGLDLRATWEDGSPAAGVGLYLEPLSQQLGAESRQAVTSESGRMAWTDLAPGRWLLRSTADERSEVELLSGATEELHWKLGMPHPLTIQVRHAPSQPIRTKIHLSLPGDANQLVEVGSVDDNHLFRLAHFEPGSWVTAIWGRRNVSYLASLDHPRFSNDPSPYLELPLERSRRLLLVTVRAPDGSLLPGARVSLGKTRSMRVRPPDGILRIEPTLAEVTRADGSCRMFSMSLNALRLTVAHDEFATWSGLVRKPTTETTVQLQPMAVVTGVVRDTSGAPVAEAEIHWATASQVEVSRSDSNGEFRLTHLPPGSLDVRVIADSGGVALMARETLELEVGESLSWSPELRPAPVIKGRALDEYGSPLVGTWVALIDGSPEEPRSVLTSSPPIVRWSAVDRDGAFSFSEDGDYPTATQRVLRLFPSRELGVPLGWLDEVPYAATDLRIGPVATGPATATVILRSGFEPAKQTPPELMLVSRITSVPIRGRLEQGAWHFEGLPAGEWSVVYWPSESLPTLVDTVTVEEGRTVRRSVESPPPWGSLTALVVDEVGERLPLFSAKLSRLDDPSVRMHAYRNRGSKLLAITADGIIVADAPPGDYLLVVHAHDMIQESRRITIAPWERTQLEIVLAPGWPVAFHVNLPKAKRDIPRDLVFEFHNAEGELRLEAHWELGDETLPPEPYLRLPDDVHTLHAYLKVDGTLRAATDLTLPSVSDMSSGDPVLVDLLY